MENSYMSLIEIKIPDSAGNSIGKGIEACGKGIEKFLSGSGYLMRCIGQKIKGEIQKYPKTTNLFSRSDSKFLSAAKKVRGENVEPNTFTDGIQYQKDNNLKQFIKEVVDEVVFREEQEKELPPAFKDTDNLLAIEEAAAETNDEQLSKMWARIFVEEATHPNSISKASVEILRKLDKETAEILQNKIFPYCADDGWFLGSSNEFIEAMMIASDLGILRDYHIQKSPTSIAKKYNKNLCVLDLGDYRIFGHLGYDFYAPYYLTAAALKIKNVLNIYSNVLNIHMVFDCINQQSCWRLSDQYKLAQRNSVYCIITRNNSEQVLFPANMFMNIDDFLRYADANVQLKG